MAQQQTKTQTKPANQAQFAANPKFNPLVPSAPRMPYPIKEAAVFDVDEAKWRALCDAVWPSAETVDGILLALAWCKLHGYDPIQKPCHIVPIWNSKLNRNVEGVWPSIAQVRITAHRTGQYAGIDDAEWGPEIKNHVFKGKKKTRKDGNTVFEDVEATLTFHEWCRMTVYRIVGGEARRFVGPKVHYLAAYGEIQNSSVPNEKWAEPGCYMLEKCAEAAALRRAFPEELGDTYVAEEMEGRRQHYTETDLGGGVTVSTPKEQAKPSRTDAKYQTGAAAGAKDVGADGTVGGAGGNEEEEQEGYELVDETGVVVTNVIGDEAYCDAVIALWDKATDTKHLQTITDNNLAELEKLPNSLGKKARQALNAATARLTTAGSGKPAAPKQEQQQQPAEEPAGLVLKDAAGKTIREGLNEATFGIEVSKLFAAVTTSEDLEAVYRCNRQAIKNLEQTIRAGVIEDYDQCVATLSGQGNLVR